MTTGEPLTAGTEVAYKGQTVGLGGDKGIGKWRKMTDAEKDRALRGLPG